MTSVITYYFLHKLSPTLTNIMVRLIDDTTTTIVSYFLVQSSSC